MVGGTTNPTGVLHPAGAIAALARPGRVVLATRRSPTPCPASRSRWPPRTCPGLLAFRNLTKTWALAGLRAGYALGDPALLALLARPRPPWPVSTLALEAVAACCAPVGCRRRRARAADALVRRQSAQAAALGAVPGVTRAPRRRALPAAAAAGRAGRAGPRRAAGRGVAVRRGDTFPGLSADHVRVAVRPAAQVQQLVRGLTAALAEVAA